ncbi:MAG TPA: response regulator [Longimicrobiales bacterium]|nr:response regulator [Longimicrobiales bacterium]
MTHPPGLAAREMDARAPAAEQHPEGTALGRPRLLVVDDVDDNRIILAALLSHAGYETLHAENGRVGVELAREHTPDLVLMDLAMPVMNGWDAVRALRDEPRTAAIPVIAVTACDIAADELRHAGFAGLLRKPVFPRAVLRAVSTCLDRAGSGNAWIDLEGS